MARTNIAVVQGSRAGTVLPAATAADVANGNSVQWDERTLLQVTNTNGAATARTITFVPRKTIDGQVGQSRVESIPAGETQIFSAFDLTEYGTPLQINGEHAEVTIRAIRA